MAKLKQKKMGKIWHDFVCVKLRAFYFSQGSGRPPIRHLVCDICEWPRHLHQNHPTTRPPTPRERVRRAHEELRMTALEFDDQFPAELVSGSIPTPDPYDQPPRSSTKPRAWMD